jgi:hypothetical protein
LLWSLKKTEDFESSETNYFDNFYQEQVFSTECEGELNTEDSNLTLKDVFSKITGPVLRISNSHSNKKSSNTNSNKEKTEIVLL